ncbi:hypothetical protein C0J52_12366 [Blattella germanica]|nr:hypothetical protein C0J52_12366 [Blattella germanica]
MFEIEGDLDLDEDFLDDIFHSECEALKKTETEGTKRTSPEDRACLSSKKHRIFKENAEINKSSLNNNEIGAAGSSSRKSGEKKYCLSEDNESLGGLHFRNDSPGPSSTSQDMFSDNEKVNSGSKNKLLLGSTVSSRLSNDSFSSDDSTKRLSKNKLSGDISSVAITPQRQIRQRKFPGPAGLLPEKDELMNRSLNPAIVTPASPNILDDVDRVCSQSSSSMFDSLQWLQMVSNFRLTDDAPLSQFTIAWVKRRAAARQLSDQKVPFLGVILHDLDCSSPDPCAKLRDKTGEIHGTLHREVWEQQGGHLYPGSVLVLRQAGVLSTGISTRRHYLNVTSNNILSIYSYSEEEGEVRRTVVNSMTFSELLKSVNDWQTRQSAVASVSTTAQPQSMYSTVGNTPTSHLRQSQSMFNTICNNILPSPRQSHSKLNIGNTASPQFRHSKPAINSLDYPTSSRPSTSQTAHRFNVANTESELRHSPILSSIRHSSPLSLKPSTPRPQINRVGNTASSDVGHCSTPLSLKHSTQQTQINNINTALMERTNFSHLNPHSPNTTVNHFMSTQASTSTVKDAVSQELSQVNSDSMKSIAAVLSVSASRSDKQKNGLQHSSQTSSIQELESPASSGRTFTGGFKPKVPVYAKLAASPSGSLKSGQYTPNCKNSTSDIFSKPTTSKENKDLITQAEVDILEGLDTSILFDDF